MSDDEEPMSDDDVMINLSGERSTHEQGIAEDPLIHRKGEIAWSSKLTNEAKRKLFEAMPDIWFSNGDGTKMQYWCRDGVWTWKHVTDNGLVLHEGMGAP